MAENATGNPGDQAPAAGSELSIPKHRFDEVAAELRRLREEVALKDQLYLQDRQRMMTPQNEEAEISPEETGLDPAVHQAVVKAAKAIAGKAISKEKQIFEQQIGILASRTEKAELLAAKGSDKAKYLPSIEQKQKQHFQMTGGFLPAETALELLLSEEKTRKIQELEARLAGNPTTAPQPTPNPTPASHYSAPPASGSREVPNPASPPPAANPNKPFSEMSVEEMEAHLARGFNSGQTL